jgi:hypothetical protein
MSIALTKARLKEIAQALYVERNPKRRVFFTTAHAIVYARRHNNHHDRHPGLVLTAPGDRRLAVWLLYHATHEDFRSLADALAVDGVDRWPLNVLKAYVAAVKKCDPKCRDIASNPPMMWRGLIQIPPTIPEVKKEFVRLFGDKKLRETWRWPMRDLLANTFKLPLRVDQNSSQRISRLRRPKIKRQTKRTARATRR